MKPKPPITKLKEILSYDPETGKVTWKINRYGSNGHVSAPAGKEAGTFMSNGYRSIKIDDIGMLIHRVAWAIFYGDWPQGDVDHINMQKADNRIANLRLASRSQNMSNRSHTKRNTLKAKGVEITRTGKYAVKIWKNYKRYHVGTFSTLEDAKAAYSAKAEELHKEFARA